jgi:hypothetical protein
MSQAYSGEVRGGVVVLDADSPPLPEGARLRIEVVAAAAGEPPAASRTLLERYASIVGVAEGLPEDLADEHDHYIHGTPRRDGR